MKISAISNNTFYKNNNSKIYVNFRGSDYSNSRLSDDFDKFENENDNNINNGNNDKPLPEWARKAMLFTLVFFTFKNEPFVQNLFDSGMMTEEELDREEFFEDVQKIRKDNGKSSAFYQVNRLYDIEQPKIEALGYNKFLLEFNLDDEKVKLEMNFDEDKKDTIEGKVQIGENSKEINYKAIFSPDNIDEFKLLLNDEGKSLVLGRDYDGTLYKIENHKKEVLNSKNVERYNQYLENLDTLRDFKFFTNENPLWRNLNYLLLIFLLYNEYKHDKNRRNDESNKE